MGKSATAYSSYGKHINLQYMSQSEYLSLTGSAHRGAMYLTSSGPGSNITSSYIMQLGPTGSDGLTVSAYKFKGDGSLLTGVVADIDGATDGTSITVAASDRLLISDSGTEKYINVSQLDNVFLRSDQADTIGGDLTTTGRLIVDSTAEATSTGDGSIQTDGGLSVALSAVIGDDLDLLSNGAIFKVGQAQPFTLTHAQANNTALVSANHRLAFGDAGDYIMGNGTDISIVGSNEINLDATTVDIDAAVSISGNTSGSTAQFAKLTASAGYFAELFVSGSTLHLGDTSISATEINQLDGITAGTAAASKAVVLDGSKNIATIGTIGCGAITSTGASSFGSINVGGTITGDTSLTLDTTTITTAEIGVLDSVTPGTAAASKALVLDASKNIGTINMLTASYAKIGELDVDLINTINKTETTLEILDKLIVVASGSNSANSDGAGLQFGSIEGTDNVASILYDHSNTGLDFNVAGSSEVLLTAGALSPASSDGNALGTTSLMWSDVFLADGAVINFNDSDVTMTHSSNLMTIAGGNTRVDRLEIDSANDYIDVDTDLKIIAAADVVIDPAGGELKVDGNVVPNSDSADSLGASGTAWANLYVDAIDLNGQGSISMGGTGRLDLDADDDTSIRASADDVITLEAGGADRVHFGAAAIYPETTDEISLGTASKNFSDLFLDSGAVVNFDGGDVTMTLSSNNLSVAGGHFQVERLRIDGSTNYLDVVSSDLRAYAAQSIHLDAASHIKLDAGGNNILFENDGTRFGAVQNSSGDLQLSASTGDLVLIGSDNSSAGNDIYLDSSDKIILDADGGSILYKDGGTTKATLGLADSGYSMHFSASAAGDIAWSSKVSGKIMELDDSAAALMLNSTNKIQFAGTGNYVHQRASNVLEVKAPTVEIDGATAIDLQTDALSIGEGGDTDVVVTFNANTNDGVLTWMEDEDYFKFSDDVLMNSDEKIQFAGTGNYVHQRASNVLEVKAPTVEIDGATKIDLQSDAITLGTGGNTDVALTFAGATSSGALTWMEDEDEFKFDDDVMIVDSKKLLFGNDSDATLGFDPTAGTDGLVLTSAKNVYLTTPSGVEPADFTPTFVISSFHNDDGKQSANNTGGGLVFAKSRSGNLMSDGDHIGGIRFRDGSGTHTANFAQVYGIATSANGNEGSLAIECRVNSANVEIAQFGYKSGSTRYGLYLNNNADHGTIKAHSFITYSDETLKDNITPIDSGLEKVMALQGVSYDWKSDGTADIGFIAQEVEKVVPQAVYGKSDGEYGLDYGSLTSVLVEAVKEQQAQIEDLKAELKNKADK